MVIQAMTDPVKTTHGGARPGSGRKSPDGLARRVNITITARSIEQAKALSGGNVSKGIALALESASKSDQHTQGAANMATTIDHNEEMIQVLKWSAA
jgi:hypothetical protein